MMESRSWTWGSWTMIPTPGPGRDPLILEMNGNIGGGSGGTHCGIGCKQKADGRFGVKPIFKKYSHFKYYFCVYFHIYDIY